MSDGLERVESQVIDLVNALTKPLYVYRMSGAQAHRQDAKGRAARTSLAKAEEELTQVVLSFCAVDATMLAAAIEDRLNVLYPEDDHHEFKAREAADVVVALLPNRRESDAKLERVRFWLEWWRSSKSTMSAEVILDNIIGVVDPPRRR